MNNKKPFISPTPIMDLSTAYWNSQVFFTANRIGLFELLSDESKSIADISVALDKHPQPVKLLLNACVALGVLDQEGDQYKNNELSNTYLVPGQPTYMGNAVLYSDDLYDTWGKLEQCLKDNKPMMPPAEYLGDSPDKTRHFVYGMHNRALGTASALVGLVDLEGRKNLLDVGGGPGTYSCLLTARYPQLKSRLMDLPGIIVHSNDIIASMGRQEQVTTFAGDYHSSEFPGDNDVVLISGVFHRETEVDCRQLIKKAAESMDKNGLLIISDVFSDEGGTSPVFATLFAINMLLTAENGRVHPDVEVMNWMLDEGFEGMECKLFPSPMPHRVVFGYKGS